MSDMTDDQVRALLDDLRNGHALQDGGPDACELGDKSADALEALLQARADAAAALTKIAHLGQDWDADTEARAEKAHEKEIAVWSENYAALERRLAEAEARGMERAAGIARRFYEKALQRADAASKSGASDDELEGTASAYGSIEHAIRAEAAAIRRATEETGT